MEQFDLECSFLVCGFDNQPRQTPILFRVENPGIVTPCAVNSGYAAIGSGGYSALTYLDWRSQSWATPLEESLYNGLLLRL
jgi:20S proteasome alpha/beta subunit